METQEQTLNQKESSHKAELLTEMLDKMLMANGREPTIKGTRTGSFVYVRKNSKNQNPTLDC